MSNLNNLDIIILIITGISALIGLSRGFVKEILSITGWLLAFACIISLLPILNPIVLRFISNGMVAGVVTALTVFIIFLICWTLFTGSIINKIRSSLFSGVDRFLGLLFGFIRAFLMVILFYILISWVIPVSQQSKFFTESKYFKIAGDFAKPIEGLIPSATLESIKRKAQGLSQEDKEEADKKKTETDELFDKLAQPKLKKKTDDSAKDSSTKDAKPADKSPAANTEGYDKKERKGLDELIDEHI